jgi:hypothetical protein
MQRSRSNGIVSHRIISPLAFLIVTLTVSKLQTTTFRGSSGLLSFYLNSVNVVVPGVLRGQPATFRIRVYDGPSFESANSFRGESNDVFVSRLGPAGDVEPDPDLSGLNAFTLEPVPEPSTWAILAFGRIVLRRSRRLAQRRR